MTQELASLLQMLVLNHLQRNKHRVNMLLWLLLLTSAGVCLSATNDTCWKCNDGKACVPRTRVCDGHADCLDSSDETAYCHMMTSDCRPPAFRCRYGACVKGSARCNGMRDCVDGSDERGCFSTDVPPVTDAPCFPALRELCDGWSHCPDGSDETYKLCHTRPPCPSGTYRCAYGACVHSRARCNGLRDCADGSDEIKCDAATKGYCFTPTEGPMFSRSYTVEQNGRTFLLYACEQGYTQIRNSQHLCLGGKWTPPILTQDDVVCRRRRPSKTFSISSLFPSFSW